MSPSSFIRRLRGTFRSSAFERDMQAELQHHLELETAALVARGMPFAEARALSARRFGSVAEIADECRDSWGLRTLDAVLQDVRFALRTFRKYPGYTAVVLSTLALGIGANAAIFSVVHAVLLRPLPFTNGERLVEIRQQAPRIGVESAGLSVKEMADYRAQMPSLDAVVEYHQMSFTLLGRGEALRVRTGVVSTNFFDVLGVTPMLGRAFRPADDSKDAPAVLLVSSSFWRNTLGGDPAIVGQTFEMNDRVHTVVGVLPPIPQFPNENDVYMPPSACPFRSNPRTIESRGARMLNVLGRIGPNATLDRVQRDLAVVAGRLGSTYPGEYQPAQTGFRSVALSVRDELTRRAKPTLLVLLATTGFVLLLVCANVANLTLARALGREREFGVRAALGASRGRIARQLMTESVLLAVTGGALGLACGSLVQELLVAFTSRFTPRAGEIAIDGSVLLFTFAISVATGVLFGLLPAATKHAGAPAGGARDAGHRIVGALRTRARQTLIAAQVAIAFVLLVGAGLLVRSFVELQRVDGGFSAERVLTMQISLDFVKYDTHTKRRAFYDAVLEKVSAEPGVQMAALGLTIPLDQAQPLLSGFTIEGQPRPEGPAQSQADFKLASPAYFQAIGMRLLQGRAFSAADASDAPPVAIINASMTRHYFRDLDPVGRRISLDGGRTWLTIVGLVNDVREYGLDAEPSDALFLPIAQRTVLGASLLVRTAGDPAAFTRRIPALVHEVDPRQPVSRVRTLEAIRNTSLAPPRLTALLVTLFALVALLVTAAGIAGVVSFSVNQRTTEIGVRMALGAPRASVLAMIVGQGLTPVLVGLAAGVAGALATARILTRLLFGVAAVDLPTYAAVAVVLTSVAALACLAPARRAAAIDPIQALRAE